MNEPSAVKAARILIADDHELVRQGMRAILQSERQWVVCGEATTGLQALTMTSDPVQKKRINDILAKMKAEAVGTKS